MKKLLLFFLLLAACSHDTPDVDVPIIPPEIPDSEVTSSVCYPAAQLTAVYDAGDFAFGSQYPKYRDDRIVGIFYFLWAGAHGYDVHEDHNEVQVPKATDVNSPYDINEILKANPANPEYGPVHAFHHWGKPYFDYYVSNDRWVIRKHAQMLSDVGVDVVFFDVANGYHYLPTVNILCEEYEAMRKNGNRTPQIAFVLNNSAAQTLNAIYTQFYALRRYPDLWFKWENKPLVLCPDDPAIPAVQKSFFTMRFTDGAASSFLGKPIKSGDTYFVDQYNHEYSRDLEPVDGGFGDNYYYYMADFIRKYKGVKPIEADKENHSIAIDGIFDDWKEVKAVYPDDKGDTMARNHYGYGRIGTLINNTGRNDIVETRIAADNSNIYFYVKTASDITAYTDACWMRLFIDVNGSFTPKWEGFGFVVNNTINTNTSTTLERSNGGWSWEKVMDINYRISKTEMELAIPLSALGISKANGYSIDFKWIDNAVKWGDIKECMRDGDSAPNCRFRYRYVR